MVNDEIRLILFSGAKDRDTLYSQKKTRPGADCGSDHELLIAKFRLKLKKVGKTTRSSRYPIRYLSLILKLPVGQQPLHTGDLGDG